MQMPAKPRDYAELVRMAGLDPSLRPVAKVSSESTGVVATLKLGETKIFHGAGIVCFGACDRFGVPTMAMPPHFSLVAHWYEPQSENRLAQAPNGGEEFAERLAELSDETGFHGIRICNGWVPILEAATRAAFAAAGKIHIVHIDLKEKYGTMRLSFGLDGVSDDIVMNYISDVEEWAEAVSSTTCSAFGTEGRLVEIGGWMMTLSERAQRLGRKGLMNALYPDRV